MLLKVPHSTSHQQQLGICRSVCQQLNLWILTPWNSCGKSPFRRDMTSNQSPHSLSETKSFQILFTEQFMPNPPDRSLAHAHFHIICCVDGQKLTNIVQKSCDNGFVVTSLAGG